ncbi:hypothetical protein [Marinifilum caeruleilacunae]|uniref:DUF4369 domain-containing protein n=1 Tax=Marinifilum caeruleilacunae TaxID=2499076 RepID=A0ABX1WUK2_9BACT|nr:hypothetical protein [Marinifilum caeruleilacunae]NOU59603.1 hypothetical protein [Marinifilum caeruleilacunae]
MMKLTLILSIFIFLTSAVHGQTRAIKGTVICEHLELLPGVSIYSIDTVEIGRTYLHGEFNISIPEETDQLMFWLVGLEPMTIKFADNCEKLEIIMMYGVHYDFISLRKADRLRKKRFDKLPEIRKKAFEQGIFKSDSINYSQEFVYYRDN